VGKFSKDKGARVERYLVNRFQEMGISAKRVPLSGAMADYPGDIVLPWIGREADIEAKARADGFKELYKWIKPRKGLIVKANRQEPLVIVRINDFAELLNFANMGYSVAFPAQTAPEAN
jgi:hypothetical protein